MESAEISSMIADEFVDFSVVNDTMMMKLETMMIVPLLLTRSQPNF